MKHYRITINKIGYDVEASSVWTAIYRAIRFYKTNENYVEIDKKTKQPVKINIEMYRDKKLEKLSNITDMTMGRDNSYIREVIE